jgi:hypothetical protein
MITVSGQVFSVSLRTRMEYGTPNKIYWLNVGIVDATGHKYYFDVNQVIQTPNQREAWQDQTFSFIKLDDWKNWYTIVAKENRITPKIKLGQKLTVQGYITPTKTFYTRLQGVVRIK